MGIEPPEPKKSVPGEAVDEKRAASIADETTKEERAAQDAKLRPEREAKFGDYLVSAACRCTS
jgi:ATP-binding cassette, subfamily B (MDR/TAP), member 1